MFAYQEPVEPPAVEVVEQPAEAAPATVEAVAEAAPEIASDAGPSEPEGAAEEIVLAEAEPPEEIRPELMDSLAARPPEAEVETLRSLAEPAAEQPAAQLVEAKPVEVKPVEAKPVEAKPVEVKPAEAKPVEAAPPTVAAKPAPVQTVLDLPGKGAFTWYLQLAAYANEVLARDTAARLSSTYPVLVLAPQSGAKALYRVFIGPLNRAESGTLLTYFRYRGFPDAFVRTAQQ
jgi:cell division septation protein DedD